MSACEFGADMIDLQQLRGSNVRRPAQSQCESETEEL